MIKVLQVVGTMNLGGAEVMLMDILRNKPAGIHFDFLVNNPLDDLYREGRFDEEIKSYGCKIRHIATQSEIGPIRYIRFFNAIYKELQPEVVHIHLNSKCGLIAMAAHTAGCKRIIAHCHADIRFRGTIKNRILGELELFIQKLLISRYATDYWGCSSEAIKRLFFPWIRNYSVVINNAINLKAYQSVTVKEVNSIRSSYNLPASTIILGNVGRIVPHKNIAFVVDVMSILQSKGNDVAFVIVGRNSSPEYFKRVMTRAREKGIPSNRLLILGERSDVPTIMHSFDVFVGPALKEGFGLVAVEAQAASIPCILSEGFPKTVDMGVGLCKFIDSFNPEIWANAIIDSFNLAKVPESVVHSAIESHGFDARENALFVCALYQ